MFGYVFSSIIINFGHCIIDFVVNSRVPTIGTIKSANLLIDTGANVWKISITQVNSSYWHPQTSQ